MTNDKTMTIEEYISFMRMLELFEAPDGIPPTLAEILNDLNIGNAGKLVDMVNLAEDVGLITSERLPSGRRKKRTTRSVEDWRERLYLFLCEETKDDLAAELASVKED